MIFAEDGEEGLGKGAHVGGGSDKGGTGEFDGGGEVAVDFCDGGSVWRG